MNADSSTVLPVTGCASRHLLRYALDDDHLQGKLLLRQIAKVKAQLAALGDLRPGSLSTQWNVCGTPGCRCKATPPEKHGPYYQVSFTRKGKSSSKFVRKEDLAAVRRELKKLRGHEDADGPFGSIWPPNYPTSAWPTSAPDPQPRTWHCPVRTNNSIFYERARCASQKFNPSTART